MNDWQGSFDLPAEARQHLEQAYAYEENDGFESALHACELAIQLTPDWAEAHNLRGGVLEKLGRKEEAIAAYREAIRLDPAFSKAQENLSEVEAELSEEEMQAKPARELLHRAMDNWRGIGLLIQPESLALIHDRRKELERLSDEELELLFRSALAAGYEAACWSELAREEGVPVDDIAREGLEAENFRTRAAAVVILGRLGERFVGPIIGMLADDYPQVRVAAIHALERLRPDGAWRERLVYECYVSAGPFVMGDDNSERYDEKPAHEVYLDAFYIGKYPVTNAEYRRYKDDIGQPFDFPEGKNDHPVTDVTWYDARNYAAWAGMRLLTEAEWEKAATWDLSPPQTEEPALSNVLSLLKGEAEGPAPSGVVSSSNHLPQGTAGGHKRKYPWGDEFDKDKSKCNTYESGIGGTTSVGKYSPSGDSPYGCADMAGNVWEWTSSLHKRYPYRADDGREDMLSPSSRVLRGGSFDINARYARSAFRGTVDPYNRIDFHSVRVGVGAAPFSPASASFGGVYPE